MPPLTVLTFPSLFSRLHHSSFHHIFFTNFSSASLPMFILHYCHFFPLRDHHLFIVFGQLYFFSLLFSLICHKLMLIFVSSFSSIFLLFHSFLYFFLSFLLLILLLLQQRYYSTEISAFIPIIVHFFCK